MKIRIGAVKHIWDKVISIYIFKTPGSGNSSWFNGDKWVVVPEASTVDKSLSLEIGEAQHLMDQLWDCGIRPTEGNGSAGAMRATEKHLEDMRTLVFKFVDNPPSTNEAR